MFTEERNARLGLTGLTPSQQRERIAQMRAQHVREERVALIKLIARLTEKGVPLPPEHKKQLIAQGLRHLIY